MPKNVMKLLKPSPHRARNDFDLSHRHVFDANFGELLPATCIETVPGDNITLHASDLLRAIPFVTSPFLRAKQHLDVWFVPYHDLWHQFDAFITKRSEPVSSAFKQADYCPWISQYSLYNAINSDGASYYDIVGRTINKRAYYLLELLGYGDVANMHGTSSDTFKVNPFRLAAYNYIWYNEYRQQYYDTGMQTLSQGSVAQLFNFDDLTCSSVATAEVTNTYNRLLAMSQMRYRTWKKDLFTGVLPSTQFGNVSTLQFPSGSVSISGSAALSGTTGSDGLRHSLVQTGGLTPPVRPDYDHPYLVNGIEKSRYNNFVNNGTKFSNTVAFVDRSENEILDEYVVSDIDVVKPDSSSVVYDFHDHTISGTASLNTTGYVAGLNFDVLALRKSEAVQIWRENALRAGNHIKDNMMSHYGVASDFNDHRPTYLGSVSAPLNIGDIQATANSTYSGNTNPNTNVGDVAGKGLSSLSEKVFKYHAKDFGVIMVMFSLLPEAEYDAVGIERTNQLLEPEDFFVPEYENLGLEAVSCANIYPLGSGKPSSNRVYGYAPRYYGYKTKIDKVFGTFVGNGINRAWSSQRSDVASQLAAYGGTMPLGLLYVNPAVFNANFNVTIDNAPQFLCDVYFDVDAVRPMSVVGLPFS